MIVDAVQHRVIDRYENDDPAASEKLMAFFNP